MEVTNNSTSESVLDYANVKFGMELEKDQILEQLKQLSFSQTLKLLDSIKKEDNDTFSEIIDLSAFSEAVVNEEELTEGKKDAIMWVYNTVKKAFGKGAAKAPDVIKKLDDAGAGKVTKWSVGAITIASVADIALDITSWVGDMLSGETIKEIAALVWKHKLPAAAVIAALYGGKKLIDYVADGGGEEETGNTTINNYYNEPVMAGEDTSRLKKLAGIKEAPADVYSTETPHGDDLQDSTMHGLMDKIEDYYHAETGDDMLDVQIGDDNVYIGNDYFSIYKNGEDLSYEVGNELEREDISIGRGPYQHKLSGDDLEKSKTMTPDQIKVLAGVTEEEKVVEGPDYRLQAQRETMNLSDQAIVELVASLYKKLDELGHREETDAEYFDDLYKRHPNESEEELKEIGYGTAATANASRATINKQNSNVANRRYNITVQDQNRDAKGTERAVAGGNKQATGQGAVRAGSEDPDDIERAHNSNQANANAQQANMNAQEIERLKQLAMGG